MAAYTTFVPLLDVGNLWLTPSPAETDFKGQNCWPEAITRPRAAISK